MTPALRNARLYVVAAHVLLVYGAYAGATLSGWLLVPGLYGAALMWWCATREYALHRRIRVLHEHARRAAIELDLDRLSDPDAELSEACCDVWFVSRRADHAAACPTTVTQRRARGEAA